ncbi:MAG TPA: PKD domain-containing protein, partial [Candidatus Absconditabacterales bacterium]|nr:PKD domain-containing protein [Candidatus Absconditabacterales bacterium]
EKLVVPYGENISLKLSLTSVPLNSISTIVWNFGDGQTKVRNSAVSSQLSESHFYNGPGIFHPTVSVYGPACLFYSQQLTVEVKKPFDCYEAYLNGSLKNFKCDMDKDGMPDICDEDIDGDGRNNILGLILFENQDCSINFGGDTRSQTNAENKFNVDFYALRDYYSHGSCLMDNCPLKTNPNQIDSNLNGVGDVCDDGFFSITGGFGSGDGQGSSNSGGNVNNTDFCLDGNNCFQDADGDGILDSDDACPTVPENYNGVEDLDGCPEIGLQDACGVSQASCPAGQTCISVVNCNQCPCQYADFVGSLIPGDTVRAGLRDFPGQVWYRYSPIRQVPLNP